MGHHALIFDSYAQPCDVPSHGALIQQADLRSLRGGGEVKDEPASQEQEGDSMRDAIDMTQE